MFLDEVGEAFFKHFSILQRVLSGRVESLAKWFNEECASESTDIDTSVVSEFDLVSEDLGRLFSILIFVAKKTNCESEKLQEAIDWLKSSSRLEAPIDEAFATQFMELFKPLAKGLLVWRVKERQYEALQKGAPIYDRLLVSPVVKFCRDEVLEFDTLDVAEYEPNLGSVSAFLIEIRIDTKDGKKRFNFQASKDEVSQIQKSLEIASKELEVLERGFQGERL